ncbi:NAD(P)-dependent oxidoreductase [Danxiaibacter flavus]|uniref:NAD(P)-dependent oxidoreductase n=1 Tax=Danxiaibacter flavus TaxID=3049108 RepID=A0ABV3ZKY6_9BACT|nr:NAD(P)-dependent oxidoreductase [Chitinophagaceae bacterium DXS]
MPAIALIREGKTPSDERVALTPAQCKWLQKNLPGCTITVQSSATRCFTDKEYELAGITVQEDVSDCDIMFGIKEVPVSMLIPDKTYVFFSHTKKKQSYNQALMHAMMDKNITLIDYECLEHEDGQRIIGFGFFAGIVGAHNGIMAYGNRTGQFSLGRVYKSKDYRALIHTYFGLKLPNIKIVVTGSGRVAHGILEIMNLMDVQDVEEDDFLSKEFAYPVYVHLKGAGLYRHRATGKYNREHFHNHPEEYDCLFENYYSQADILMNGIYWTPNMPRLFEMEALKDKSFRISTIADITDDKNGSVPCNLGDAVISDPVYGVNRQTFEKTAPYLPESVDVMAVGNLPNELPRDASRYFGEQLIKHVLGDLVRDGNEIIEKATILRKGKLTEHFEYLSDYALH